MTAAGINTSGLFAATMETGATGAESPPVGTWTSWRAVAIREVLLGHGPMTTLDIRMFLGNPPRSAVHGALRVAEKAGYIVRVAHVHSTPPGKAIVWDAMIADEGRRAARSQRYLTGAFCTCVTVGTLGPKGRKPPRRRYDPDRVRVGGLGPMPPKAVHAPSLPGQRPSPQASVPQDRPARASHEPVIVTG